MSVPLGGADSPIRQIIDGSQTIAAAGTAEKVVQDAAHVGPCTYVEVQALETNTKQIGVGGSGIDETVASANGVVLQPGESRVWYVVHTDLLFADPQVNGEGVRYSIGR